MLKSFTELLLTGWSFPKRRYHICHLELYVFIPQYFLIMPTQIRFQLKYLVFVVEMILEMIYLSINTLQTQNTNAQKIAYILLSSFTNWCIIYIKTMKYFPFCSLARNGLCFSIIVLPLLHCISPKDKNWSNQVQIF